MIEEEDMNFYPLEKAMCLDNDEEEADPFQEKVDEQLTEMETNLSSLRSASFHIFCNLLAHAFCP